MHALSAPHQRMEEEGSREARRCGELNRLLDFLYSKLHDRNKGVVMMSRTAAFVAFGCPGAGLWIESSLKTHFEEAWRDSLWPIDIRDMESLNSSQAGSWSQPSERY